MFWKLYERRPEATLKNPSVLNATFEIPLKAKTGMHAALAEVNKDFTIQSLQQ